MAKKGYLVSAYRSIKDPDKLAAYAKLAQVWDRTVKYINDPKTQDDALKIMSKRVGLTPEQYKPLLKGTHLIDLADCALGPVTEVRASGSSLGWLSLLLVHGSGAVSDLSLCVHSDVGGGRTELEIFSTQGGRLLDARKEVGPAAFATLRSEFSQLCRGAAPGPHTPGVSRGLELQRILDQAARQLAD